jgi:hypothetical protein
MGFGVRGVLPTLGCEFFVAFDRNVPKAIDLDRRRTVSRDRRYPSRN